VTEQISRPATLEDLKTLLRSLNANGVDYLLIGGYALAAHGYQRATTDIDIVFPATAAAGQRVKEALMILPDQAAKELEPQWFEEGENIRVADAFVVDIMLNANGETYDTLRRIARPCRSETDWGVDACDRRLPRRCLHRICAAAASAHLRQTRRIAIGRMEGI
jgi:hypothetical protein